MTDLFSERCGDLLTGSYDCVDRIVLNAYFSLGHSPGGFRVWWRRWHGDSDEQLDNAHLMRLAGRFARRVRASAQAHGIAVIDCKAEERKHQIAEEYLAEHPVRTGVFLVLVARAPATVWKVSRSGAGVIHHLEKTRQFVNHYSFHIMDPTWGHVTIKISGHPPFGAQVILNGHEYVACAGQKAGLGFAKEGNCFTRVSEPERLAQIADTLSQPGTIGRLSQVIDRWIYTACLCFGLDIDEQQQSRFRLRLLDLPGRVQPQPAVRLRRGDGSLVQHGGGPHPIPARRAEGAHAVRQQRPSAPQTRFRAIAATGSRDRETSVEPDHLQGPLRTVDAEGLHQRRTRPALRGDRAQHQSSSAAAGRWTSSRQITTRLTAMVDRFTSMLDCVDVGFLPDGILDQLPAPSQVAGTRIGGIDMNIPRVRAALAAALALAVAPAGFTVAQFTAQVRAMTGQTPDGYSTRQGAYDLRKLRGKQLVIKPGRTRRYHVPGDRRAHHHRAAHRPRQGHRPPHQRNPDTTTRPATQELDHRSTATTKPSASTCRPCSTTSASHSSRPPHRQHLVDRVPASL